MKVLVIGYYNRNNWGDDLFEYIFKKELLNSDDDITIINIDDLELLGGKIFDKIIVGGGDIVNNYFLNPDNIKLIDFVKMSGIPIDFVGIGIPYTECLPLMDVGDKFYLRNKTDYNLTKNRYNIDNTFLIPDLGFGLKVNYTNNVTKVKQIGVCIPFNYGVHEDFNNDLVTIINNLAETYKVHLIPFDTNTYGDSDLTYIKNLNGLSNDIVIVDKTLGIQEMVNYFKDLDFIVASRFHSIITSILCEKPFISLYTTRKIDNIRIDNSEIDSMFISLPKDTNDLPVNINVELVMKIIDNIIKNYTDNVNTVRIVKKRNVDNLNLVEINNELHKLITRQSAPQYITVSDTNNLITHTLRNVLSKISNKISLRDIDTLFNGGTIINIMYKQRNIEGYKQILTQEILYSITGDPYGPYYDGLYNNVLTNNCVNQLKWIINDYYQNYYYKQNNENFTIINKNFQNLHRSGWQYIVTNLIVELNNNNSYQNPLIIDTYIDKTFHWNKDFYKSKGIIPYTKAWIGFVHHTYSDYNNSYNCSELFNDSDFIKSLQNCKCLIVMTDYLQNQIVNSLAKLNINVDVYSITHPTKYSDVLFDMDLFNKNPNKQIIQIGNWLRNVFTIYQLNLPKNSIINGKSILKNRNSDSYFPPKDFLTNLNDSLIQENNNTSQTICRNAFTNMHIKGLYDYISFMENSVIEIPYLDNVSYDTLLSQNIVFLNLVDASACNTIIECIIRNVPLLVNRIPPVVEMLGKNYPLYYDTIYEASKLLEDPQNIQDAFDYLTKIEKFAFNIDEFINRLKDIISKYI